jgi:hypothetical protein
LLLKLKLKNTYGVSDAILAAAWQAASESLDALRKTDVKTSLCDF